MSMFIALEGTHLYFYVQQMSGDIWPSLYLTLDVLLRFEETSLSDCFSVRSGYSPGGRVNKNLFTRLLIRAFSEVEKPLF